MLRRIEGALALLLTALMLCLPALAEETPLFTPGWPSGCFPDVPEYPSGVLMIEVSTDTAVIYLEEGADDGFAAYVETLTDAGFDLYAETGIAVVLSCGGTDVVLQRDPEEPFIRILNEPDCGWGTDEYLTPLFGRFVAVRERENGETVTVRSAAPDDMLAYFDALEAAGWETETLITASDGTAYGIFTKKNRRIEADYYMLGFDFTLTMTKR